MASNSGIIFTAFLTALATSLGSQWLPDFVEWGWDTYNEVPIVTVYVKRQKNQRPVSGVQLSIYGQGEDAQGFVLIDSGETNERGIAQLTIIRKSEVYLEAVARAGRFDRWYRNFHEIKKLPFRIELDPDDDDWSPEKS